MGRVATYLQLHGGPPMFQSSRQNQPWPTNSMGGYTTGNVLCIPNASERVIQSAKGYICGGYITSAAQGVPEASERVTKKEVAHMWAGWLHNPCRPGGSATNWSGE